MAVVAACGEKDDKDIVLTSAKQLADDPEPGALGRFDAHTEEIRPEIRARRGAARFGALDAEKSTAERFGRHPGVVALEADDRLRDLTTDGRDGERTDLVALQDGPRPEAIDHVGTGIDTDLATNAVRAEDETDDEVVVASRSRG